MLKNLVQMLQISFQFFDFILLDFISFFWDFNGGSARKEHMQILVLKSKPKMMEQWKRRPFNGTKTGVHRRHFYWPSPQISKKLFQGIPVKVCYCFIKSMYFKNMLWNMLMIESFKKYFHWSSKKQWMHWPLFPVS